MAEQSGPSGKQQETGEIDVSALSEDKIKQLMRSDPRFITRLINVGPGTKCILATLHACCMDNGGKLVACTCMHWSMQQLDKSMHGMMAEKTRRQEQIRADEAELEKLDTMVKTHIQPNLVSAVYRAAQAWLVACTPKLNGSVQCTS